MSYFTGALRTEKTSCKGVGSLPESVCFEVFRTNRAIISFPLVRNEIGLATAEMKQKGGRIGIGVGISSAGGLAALYGLAAVLAAVVLGLATVLDAWLAALVVGVFLLALAGVLTATGIGQVRSATPPVPEQAIRSTRQDIETVKESISR